MAREETVLTPHGELSVWEPLQEVEVARIYEASLDGQTIPAVCVMEEADAIDWTGPLFEFYRPGHEQNGMLLAPPLLIDWSTLEAGVLRATDQYAKVLDRHYRFRPHATQSWRPNDLDLDAATGQPLHTAPDARTEYAPRVPIGVSGLAYYLELGLRTDGAIADHFARPDWHLVRLEDRRGGPPTARLAAATPTREERDAFWAIVDPMLVEGDVEAALSALGEGQLALVGKCVDWILVQLLTERQWGAAYLANGGCSVGMLIDWVCYLVLLGKPRLTQVYRHTDEAVAELLQAWSSKEVPTYDECESVGMLFAMTRGSATDDWEPISLNRIVDYLTIITRVDFDDLEEMTARYPKTVAQCPYLSAPKDPYAV